MICRNCSTEIADRAIVCYRCGTATTEARFKPVPTAMGRGSRPFAVFKVVALGLVVVLVLLALAALVPGCPMINSRQRDHRTDASPRLDAARDRGDVLGPAA